MSVIVIGAAAPVGLEVTHGVVPTDVLADKASARFDNDTETWTVIASDGRTATAAIAVDVRPSTIPVIAGHGIPNYFRIPGLNTRRESRYVTRCLRLIERSGAARIEARGTVVLHRWRPQPVESSFFLTGTQPEPDDLYDGPATVTVGERAFRSRVRLRGHLDAVDGRYHWHGTLFETLPAGRSAGMTLTIDDRTAAARVVEQTPWGTHMIAGIGDPPFG